MSSIPLPALDIRTPQMESPLDKYAKVMQLKNIMQRAKLGDIELQKGGMELQQAEQQQRDMQIVMKAFQESGGNYEKTIAAAAAAGASPFTLQKLKDQQTAQETQLATLDTAKLANLGKTYDVLRGHLNAIKLKPPEEQAAAYADSLASLQQQGINTAVLPKTFNSEAVPFWEAMLTGGKEAADRAAASVTANKPIYVTPGNIPVSATGVVGTPIGDKKPTPARVNYREGTIIGADGVTRDINDPNLNPADKALVAAAKRAHGEELGEQVNKEARAEARQERIRDAREAALSSPTKTMIETAPKVKELAQRVIDLTNQQVAQLGPAAGRWTEFWTGAVGTENKEFARLRTNVSLLRTLLMRMHMGARGGVMLLGEFKDLIDSGKQAPENMVAAGEEIGAYADDLIKFGAEHGHAVTPKSRGGPVRPTVAGPKGDPLGIF